MTIIGEGRLGCSANKERGTCANGKKVAVSRVEDAVLDGIKTQMLQPELIREFADTFKDYIAMHSKSEDERRRQTDKQHAEIDAKVARLLDVIQEGGPISLVARLRELERTKESLDRESRGPHQPRRSRVCRTPS